MTGTLKKLRQIITTFSLVGTLTLMLMLGGCADSYYAGSRIRAPEAKYNTYYAPDYYPYYPWDGYYGGAYYYGE